MKLHVITCWVAVKLFILRREVGRLLPVWSPDMIYPSKARYHLMMRGYPSCHVKVRCFVMTRAAVGTHGIKNYRDEANRHRKYPRIDQSPLSSCAWDQ